MKVFAERLRKAVADLEISNAEAARRAGLAERRFNNYCNDEREPDLATLVRIAKALGTTPDFLLGFTDPSEASPEDLLIPRLLSAVGQLSNSELDVLLIQVEALAKRHSNKP